ncbi:MAG: glycosyltransferase [Acetivibrionales bacterium]|jgi:glycosyltransferase involved in cell wall biosynthesis
MKTPKVSVIVPIYNPGEYLRQCLDTIISQTLTDIEIICVNDGSTDESAEVLAQYQQKDNRIRIVTQENKGGGPARNAGIEIARGEYLSFLDADDYFHKDMLKLASEKADESHADVVIFDIYTVDCATDETGNPTWALEQQFIPPMKVFSKDDIPDTIMQLSVCSVWNKLYRREKVVLEKTQFQANPGADDIYFSLMSIALAKRVSILNKRLLYYRMDNPTSQLSGRTKAPLNHYFALRSVKEALEKRNFYSLLEKTFVNRAAEVIIPSLDAMKTGQAFELLYNSIRTEMFSYLKLDQKEREYFYYQDFYDQIQIIKKYTAAEYLFERIENMRQNAFPTRKGFVFPYNKVDKNDQIVLYGAGDVGQAFYRQIKETECCNLVLWVDRNYQKIGFPVKNPETIKEMEYDKIIISVVDKYVADSIRNYLKEMGVKEDKIIWVDSRIL